MKDLLESFLSKVVHYGGLTRIVRRHSSGIGIIVMLHEVHEDAASELMTGCSIELLESLVHWLRDMGWDIVSINEALGPKRSPINKPFAVLTFDDGYRDNLECALPILDRLGAPFTIYVPTHAITRELYAWWLGLRYLFQSRDLVFISAMRRKFRCADRAAKIAALKESCAWVARDFNRADALNETFTTYGISIRELVDRYFLDEKSIQSIACHQLVSIGAHSTSHVALTTISEEAVWREMADNRAFLQQLLDKEIVHFAYPYGASDRREFAAAKEVGFLSAVTTRSSPIYDIDLRSPFALPRVEFVALI